METGIDKKILIAKVSDAVSLCEKQYSIKTLGFLTPAEVAIIKSHLPQISVGADVRFTFFGGYQDAERCIFAALPEYACNDDLLELITVLEIYGRDTEALTHRDFLGSLLGLGLRREKIGDILRLPDRAVVFVAADIADYIISNLQKVGRHGVKIRKISFEELELPKRCFKEIRASVAALRLDCIIAAALKTSRSGAAEVIKGGRVSVNWLETENVSLSVKPGDIFSVRGAGRFRLSETINRTQKGRLGICIEKAI